MSKIHITNISGRLIRIISPIDNIVCRLEYCESTQFENLDYIGEDNTLSSLRVGNYMETKYERNIGDSPINVTWLILGYNASIPKYVKYRNGSDKVYISSIQEDIGELITNFVDLKVFKRTHFNTIDLNWNYQEVGIVLEASDEKFTYGNNFGDGYDARYQVPLTITVNNKVYKFCGYNITFSSKHLLLFDNATNIAFNTTNRWYSAQLRYWMNGLIGNYGIKPLSLRFDLEPGLILNIVPVVNRTYWQNKVDTTIDNFWLLGNGNVNCTKTGYVDDKYDTSIFSTVFPNNERRLKTIDGNTTPLVWFTRSASTYNTINVGTIDTAGMLVGVLANLSRSIVPAYTIG